MNPINAASLPTQPKPPSRHDGVIPIRTSPSSSSPTQSESPQTAEANAGTAMPADAYKNNERLFPILKNGLSNKASFVASAAKVLVWVSVSKAFYKAARPWVSRSSHMHVTSFLCND